MYDAQQSLLELESLKAALQQANAQLQAARAQLVDMQSLQDAMAKMKERLMGSGEDGDGVGVSVPYAEFVALEDELQKLRNLSRKVQDEFSQLSEMKRALSMSPGGILSPIDTMQV